jgi:hypothetical protein
VPERTTHGGRHRFDPSALVAGIFFLAVAATHLSQTLGHRAGLPPQVIVPAVVVGLGVVAVVRIFTRSRRRTPRA